MKERLLLFKKFGALLAADDFGIKASNFMRVARLDPEFIKLDRSLITDKDEVPLPNMYLKYLVDFFHDIDKKVILEGVETKAQYENAKASNVDFVQGFYWGEPQIIKPL